MPDYSLYPTQMRALTTDATEILYGGAVGGGKSYFARVASIMYSLEIPGLITYIFRRTFKELLANHIYTSGGYLEMLADLIRDKYCVFSKQDYSFTFSNGSRIQLAHSQYEGDIYSYQGAQIAFLIIDEATHFTEGMIRFIRSRVRLGSLCVPPQYKSLFPRILYTANPGGVSHHFFKSNFVNYGPNRTFRAPRDEGSMLRIYIPSLLKDNKVLLENDPNYAERLLGLGDTALVEALLNGDWDSLSQGGFRDVWDSRTHVIPPFQIPASWTVDRAYDYGSAAPAACIWCAESDGSPALVPYSYNMQPSGQDQEQENEEKKQGYREIHYPRGTIFIIHELYMANKRHEGLRLTPQEQGQRIRAQDKQVLAIYPHPIQPGPADAAIFSSEPGVETVANQIAKHGVRFVKSIKTPGSRVQGVQLMRQRLQAAKTHSMEVPGIYFFNTAQECIRTIPDLQPDNKNPDDIDTHGEDHLWDCVRYRVLRSARAVQTTRIYGL